MANESNDPNWSIQLPGLPQLKTKDLPSFLLPSNVKGSLRVALPPFKELINTLDSEINPKILVNTFDELEPNALKAIENYKFYGIGPLIPSAFLDGNDPLDSCFGADLFDKSNDYIEWLYTKENSSVVYISFGSLMNPSISQMEEISKGLIDIGRPFLWIIKEDEKNKESEKKVIGCIEELEKIGKIVPWCSQLEVLRHPSLGCFVSHCGWNSALESLACGVPVVAFPQWTDQMTNAKQIEDVWKSGVRVNVNEDGIVESEELKRCIECVMDGGVKGEEMRKNAKKWKELAREAVKEGGSSHKNLKAFIDEVAKVEDRAKQGCPFKRIIYTTLTAWIGLLAKSINVPSTFLWIQPASVLNIYYHFFNGYEDSIKNCSKDQSFEFPGLPLLSRRDFPSIVFNDSNDWTLLAMKEHVELLKSETNQKVLVNTFDALNVIENVTIFGIGPLIPSVFLDGNDSSDTSFGVDMRRSLDNYMDSKAKESVIYIAFGSYSQIPNQLMEEIAYGLVLCKRPFLWIIREGANGEKPFEKLSCKEELEELGKTVDWCSQVESMESLASGVPAVACPLWIDQLSNAKLIQDVWKTGVRVNANDEGVIERNEFARCIEIVVGDGEIRKNAKKWRDLAKDAMKESGSSNVNLKAYVNEILLGE
ncbi:hypothetical protein KY284_012116 [Solanum tuberosum]|nr:hypothetical protein KY284_012116 [Solanum tuberosum]